jgi:hypothetical protein
MMKISGKVGLGRRKMAKWTEELRGDIAEDFLYEYINVHRGLSIYGLAKNLRWSTGKVHGIVERLENNGLVRTDRVEERGRLLRKVYPVSWKELLPREVQKELYSEKSPARDRAPTKHSEPIPLLV